MQVMHSIIAYFKAVEEVDVVEAVDVVIT